jgi:hypothetical protein
LASPHVPSAELQQPAGGSIAEAAALRLQSAYRRHCARASRGTCAALLPLQQAPVESNGEA